MTTSAIPADRDHESAKSDGGGADGDARRQQAQRQEPEGEDTERTETERTGAEREEAEQEETEKERLDRNYAELLQELRVAQTGVQLLVAFLLSIAFSPRFPETTPFQRSVYFTTLLLAVSATVLLIAPVSHHRIVFRHRRKQELVATANKEALVGLTLLALALLGAVLLISDFLFDGAGVPATVAGVAVLFVVFWLGLPLRDRAQRPS